ncbi:NAD(P)/FAD-dependent oxidoreductase [Novosphingobium resinovorum]|uniref:flavin monoamine oxidase family protein n=1 Tax=Novosphingobium TaxID=165696 RepID=UPI001B3C5FC1|nr:MULTISPECIES: NAD(P)/FAD-dependent oxidoreductase [Novosphingobium]MBF7013505.1 FAD-dependent oxidoreductase [Novosphingobium sp. HR1a]WJM25653.1 NAD(P)/FAD-dependent oxidoreductase [Novosphingobium resinovorum]
MTMDRRSFTLGMANGAIGVGMASMLPAAALAAPAKKAAAGLDVLVLGAGVSGLQAAWMLEEQGLKVAVLEGRQRVGGRVMTLLDEPGYPEMGFNSMGEGYGRGIDAAQRAGVTLEDIGGRYRVGKPPMLWMNGQPLTREEWARHPGNPFPDAMKSVLPAEMVNKLVAERTPLKDWNAWTDPASAVLDVPLHDFLRAQGLSDPAIRLANDVSPYYGTNSWDVSALMLEFNDGFVKAQFEAGTKSFGVKGGNLHLPMGMAKLLKGDVILGKEVVAIEATDSGSTVYCRDGSTFSAKRVICSLPFSTLRYVKILPGLSGAQAEAVSQIAYQPLSMAFLTATAPFWDEDGLSPGMWTDGLAGTVIPQHYGATPDEVTGLLVQARGGLANYWDRLGRDKALAMIVAQIEAMRPAVKGKLVARTYFSWSQEVFNGGDWAYFGPGQVSRLVPEMSKPAGRLHFCGEHTATGARGLEGALESAERVALEILEA